MSGILSPYRQGQCSHCRIIWTWSMRVLLRDQVCRSCFRPLTRVREGGEFAELTLEGRNRGKDVSSSANFRRPALRYFGGKWRLAPWILSFFPPHVCYTELFGGAMSVLLQKSPAKFEVYNDIDGDICAFFRILRERPDELRRAINLTPYSRRDLRLSCVPVPPDYDGGTISREMEQARRIFVRCWQGFGSGMADSPGWRYDTGKAGRGGSSSLANFRDVDRLPEIAARLLSVQIEESDAVDAVGRFDTPGTLFFADPPYLPETRSPTRARRGYRCEMTVEDHIALSGIQGMAVVCGYPSALYDSLYAGWHCVFCRVRTQNFEKQATECLWLNARAWASQQQSRLSLFPSHDFLVSEKEFSQ